MKLICVSIPMEGMICFALDFTCLQLAGFPSRKQQSNLWHRSVVSGMNIFFSRRIIAAAHVPSACAFSTDFQSLLTAFDASSSLGNSAERRDSIVPTAFWMALTLGLWLAWTSKREQSCTKSTDSCTFVYFIRFAVYLS